MKPSIFFILSLSLPLGNASAQNAAYTYSVTCVGELGQPASMGHGHSIEKADEIASEENDRNPAAQCAVDLENPYVASDSEDSLP